MAWYHEPYDVYDAELEALLAEEAVEEILDAPPFNGTVEDLIVMLEEIG